jgi:hypothetical protein
MGSCSSQTECGKFKNGKFTLIDPKLNHESIIERIDNKQTELNLITGSESEYLVEWINDCEYNLKIIQGSEDAMKILNDKILYVKIISTEKDRYTFEVTIEGIDYKATQTMQLIK